MTADVTNTVEKVVSQITSFGKMGKMTVEIRVSGTHLPDLSSESIVLKSGEAARDVQNVVLREILKQDPEVKKEREQERLDLIKCFPDSQFKYFQEIPNRYCSQYCCADRPWFLVTTFAGVFEIGWRKRVISISWEGTIVKKSGMELFPDEDQVTRLDRGIHAWSLDDAARYIKVVLEEAEKMIAEQRDQLLPA